MVLEAGIFDMNGVIVNSERYSKNVEIPFIQNITPKWDKSIEGLIKGLGMSDLHTLLSQKGGMEMTFNEFPRRYKEMTVKVYRELVTLNDYLLEFLDLLSHEDINLGLATSSQET